MTYPTDERWRALYDTKKENYIIYLVADDKRNLLYPVALTASHYGTKHNEVRARMIAESPALVDAAREFCRKVDAGEAKSKKSYAAFAAILERIDAPPSPEQSGA